MIKKICRITAILLCICIIIPSGTAVGIFGEGGVSDASLAGKNIVCLGDSITYKQQNPDRSWPKYLEGLTGANVTNCGFVGASMSRRNNADAGWDDNKIYTASGTDDLIRQLDADGYAESKVYFRYTGETDGGLVRNYFYTADVAVSGGTYDISNITLPSDYDVKNASSMYRLVRAARNDDFSFQDFAFAYGNMPSSVPSWGEQLEVLKNVDFSATDIVFLALGTNDWDYQKKIEGSGVDYYGDAVRDVIDNLYAINPSMRIILVSPTWRWNADVADGSDNSDVTPKQSTGLYVRDFVTALANIANEYGIEFFEMYYGLGFNASTRLSYFNANDGVHPNLDGRIKIANRIYALLTGDAPATGGTVVVGGASAQNGDTVSVDVSLLNNPGFRTCALTVSYDTSRLQLIGVRPDPNAGGNFDYTDRAVWTADDDTTYCGTFLTLDFKVLDNATAGDAFVDVCHGPGDICNSSGQNVDFSSVRGNISISSRANVVDVYATDYTLTFTNSVNISAVRIASGDLATSGEIKNAPDRIDINAALIRANTDGNGNFTYELPDGGIWSVWYKLTDGTTKTVSGIDVTHMTQTVDTYGTTLTFNNLYGVRDFYFAKGHYDSYRELKDADGYVGITSAKFGSAHSYVYNGTALTGGEYTLIVRYDDPARESQISYFDIKVTVPTVETCGRWIKVGNIDDVRVIRVAPGTYSTSHEVKNAEGCRNFTAGTIAKLGFTDPLTVSNAVNEDGSDTFYTVAVEYRNLYTEIHNVALSKLIPEYTVSADSITFTNLDALDILRYAPGTYTTVTEIKNAAGNGYVKGAAVTDGTVTLTGLDGAYTFLVQYVEDSRNIFTLEFNTK